MALQRILLVTGLSLLLCTMAAAQPVDSAGAQSETEHAAVVVSMYGDYVGSVNITLPPGKGDHEARQALERVSKQTGWQFDTPIIGHDGYTSIQANALGLTPVKFGGVELAAPFIMALKGHPRLVVVFIGVRTGDGGGRFENPYITADWLQSGGICSYQITVKDGSFESIAELTAPEPAQGLAAGEDGRASWPWLLLVIGSAALGVFIYLLSSYLARRRR